MASGESSTVTISVWVQWVDDTGTVQLAPLSECGSRRFEMARSLQSWPTRQRVRKSGLWWSATTGRHVGYGSRLARDHAMVLDFDEKVINYVGTPIRLGFREGARDRWLTPDFFARRDDGTALVVQCRSAGRTFADDSSAILTSACAAVGWQFDLVHELDEPRGDSLRWLAGYRHPRFDDPLRADQLVAWCNELGASTPVGAILQRCRADLVLLGVLYHLLWHRRLVVDLTQPLSEASLVGLPPTGA